MNSTSHVFETSSSSRHQHPNVKEEIADSVELVIKVEGECVDIEVDLKVEDEEKPNVCQCEECGSGGRGRVDWCTRAVAGCSGQAIKKEEWESDDEQSGDMTVKEEGSSRGRLVKVEDDADCAPVRIKREGIKAETGDEVGCRKKAKRTEILVKEEVKEEDELNVAGPLTQRCGSASADSVIVKFEDEEVTCPCEECGMVKREEEGTGSSDNETVVEGGSEDEEDWLASSGSSLGSSSEEEEEEETEDASTELVDEPNETVSSTAPLEVSPVAGADIEQARTAKGRKRHRCPQCQKMVARLPLHLLTHTGQRPHICDRCGKSFNQKANLKQHLKTHSDEKAFSCEHCGKCFTLKAHLKTHLLIHTGEKAFPCDQCGRSFTQKSHLKRHLTIHSCEKAFSCDQCGKCFDLRRHLTVHLKRHSGEKAHQCDQCPNAFVSSTELTIHRRQKHTGQRPYTCHIANCGKAFANQSNLRKHLKQHTGDKRHQCVDCEMRFITSTELTIHRRRKHTGEKRYQCEDCERRFVTSAELTIHRRHKHSTERPYRCTHSGCNYAAATNGKLKRHLKAKKKHRQ